MKGLQELSFLKKYHMCLSHPKFTQNSELTQRSGRKSRIFRTIYFSLSVNRIECEYVKKHVWQDSTTITNTMC